MLTTIKTYKDFVQELDKLDQRLPRNILREGEYMLLERLAMEIEEAFELYDLLSNYDYQELSSRIDRMMSIRRMVAC